MRISPYTFSAAILVIGLAGCAGRSPQPVAVVQPQDRFADCAAIQAEVLATAGTEITALNSRQQYLAVLAEQRRCGAPQAAQPPLPPQAVPMPPPTPVR
jgi:hypothetical protein